MTPQEQQLIDGLVDRIRSTQAVDKDDEADRYLHSKLDSVPDVLYLLAQTVLVQQYGLDNAQGQITGLQQQIDEMQGQLEDAQAQLAQAQQKKPGSFLGKIFGTDEQQPQGGYPPQGYQGQPYPPQGGQYAPVNTGYPPPPPPYGQPSYGQPMGQPGYVQQPPASGGFMRGALQTAAGVAAGAMVFEGMESMFRGFGGSEHERPTEVVNNNYYGDESREHEHRESGDDSSFYNPSQDASRQGVDGGSEHRGFADTDNDNSGFDDNSSNDFSDGGDYDDSGSDDGGGFDDGGSNDDSF
ncbi:DUF2076 domain-containing protein [Granulicella cerasi]|uniref:DUF2076 domain-containing protein n=1 Tax=Granulicella cerasi TaxID=741063 RepID=A0ABW1Z8W9_9BACT|nr:DUF2076 domain-containing protein [Granulicella cerasi]